MNEQRLDRICTYLCKSRAFETGEGACTLLCMDQLGDARVNCRHKREIFGKLAEGIIKAYEEPTA